MEKFQMLVKLMLEQDSEKNWVSYSEGGDNIAYGNMPLLIKRMDGDYDYVSLNISNGEVFLDDVKDDYFSKQQAEQLLELIKTKYKERQIILKRKAWEKLGIFNG